MDKLNKAAAGAFAQQKSGWAAPSPEADLLRVPNERGVLYAEAFGEAIRENIAKGGSGNREARKYTPKEALELVKAAGARYAATRNAQTFPFKVGDVVTPVDVSNVRGRGMPHFVVEIAPDAGIFHKNDNPSSARFGHRLNLRVATVMDGRVLCFWNEAHEYEFWDESIKVVPDDERHSMDPGEAFARWLSKRFGNMDME